MFTVYTCLHIEHHFSVFQRDLDTTRPGVIAWYEPFGFTAAQCKGAVVDSDTAHIGSVDG